MVGVEQRFAIGELTVRSQVEIDQIPYGTRRSASRCLGIVVNWFKSSLIAAWRVIEKILPYVASAIGTPLSLVVTYLYSAPSRTLSSSEKPFSPTRLASWKLERAPVLVHCWNVSPLFCQTLSTDFSAPPARICENLQ